MLKVGVFVGEKGHWGFFREIYADLAEHYQVKHFQEKQYSFPLLHGRLNRWAHAHGIRSLLGHSDVCFFEWASELLLPASYMPKQCPLITRLHSYELFMWAPKIAWENVDAIILVSRHMYDKFVKQFPDHAHKAQIIYNGVALDKFHPPMQREFNFNLGMLCSIHPIKRIYEAVLAVYELKQQGYRPHLHIAGGKWPDGYFDDYYAAICGAIAKLNLENDVTLHGHVENTAAWLQKIDLFISNSYWEGQQVALLEAMACGCYCVAHRWDGAEEILPEENLYFTDAELQQRIIAYAQFSDEEKQQRHDQMRARACEKFDAERLKLEIRKVIETVAGVTHTAGSRMGHSAA